MGRHVRRSSKNAAKENRHPDIFPHESSASPNGRAKSNLLQLRMCKGIVSAQLGHQTAAYRLVLSCVSPRFVLVQMESTCNPLSAGNQKIDIAHPPALPTISGAKSCLAQYSVRPLHGVSECCSRGPDSCP